MTSKPVALATCSFATQKDAESYIRGILHSYDPPAGAGSRVKLSPEHQQDMIALLLRFDAMQTDAINKVRATDVCEVFVKRHDRWASPEFWMRRRDGSEFGISYSRALSGRAKPELADLLARITSPA
jgi:hypothetical protein